MASMNSILDAVADGISRLVYFYIEAEENTKPVTNILPGAQALNKALDLVIGIGNKLAVDWAKEERTGEMIQVIEGLKKNSQEILSCAEILNTKNALDQDCKKQMFHAARGTLKQTALLLQSVDEHDVGDINKWCAHVEGSIQQLSEGKQEAVSDFVHFAVSVGKLVETRISILADPKYKRRLEDAKKNLTSNTQPYIQKYNGDKKEAASLKSALQAAITEIMLVSRLSCENMWAGVDLDLSYLFDRNVNLMDELRACHKQLKKELHETSDLIFSPTMRLGEADLKFVNIKDVVRRECFIAMSICDKSTDHLQQREILSCIDRLKEEAFKTQKQLRKTAKDRQNDDEMELFLTGKTHTIQASKDLLAACSSLLNSLFGISDELNRLLDRLANFPDPKQSIEDAKRIADLLGQEAALARRLGPFGQEAQLLEDQRVPLLKAVKEYLANPNDPNAQKRLRDLCNQIKDQSVQAVDKAGLPAEVQLLDLAQEIPPELDALFHELDSQVPGSPLPSIAVADKLAHLGNFADQVAQTTTDPTQRAKLEKLALDLIAPAELIKFDANSPERSQILKPVIEGAKNTVQDLIDTLIQQPVDIIKEIEKALGGLADGSILDNPEPFLPLKEAIDKATIFAKASLPHSADPNLRKKLLDLSKKLTDGLGSLVDSFQKHQDQADDPKKKAQVKKDLDNLKNAALDFDELKVQLLPKSAYDDQDLQNLLEKLEDLINSPTAHTQDRLRVAGQIPEAVRLATQPILDEVIPSIQDPLQKTKLRTDCEKLNNIGNSIVPLVKHFSAAPSDPKTKNELLSTINDAKIQVKQLNDHVDAAQTDPFALGNKLVDCFEDATHALKIGEPKKANDAIKETQEVANKLIKLINTLGANASDPKLKKALLDAAKSLASAMSLMNKAFTELLKNPNDPKAWKMLEDAKNQLVGDLAQLYGGALADDNALDELTRNLTQELENLKNNPNVSAKDLIPILIKQKILAQAKAVRASDPNRHKNLIEAAKKIASALAHLSSALPPKNIQSIINQALETNLVVLGKDHTDEIVVAAESVTQAIRNKKADPDTPAGKMYAVSGQIAKLMEQLSVAAKAKNVKEMILLTRKITQEIKEFAKSANEVAATCTDRRLKENLICAAQSVSNFSTQLKILTAVKSSTGEDDEKAAKNQLITCAKGLANAVIYSCGAAESASIRAKKSK